VGVSNFETPSEAWTLVHLDENCAPCSRHRVSPDNLFTLALLGSGIVHFHHELASTLQRLMMAFDEITETSAEVEGIRDAAAIAQHSLEELKGLLASSRALAKASKRECNSLSEILAYAAERTRITLRGEIPNVMVHVAAPSFTFAMSLLLDLAADPNTKLRTADVMIAADDAEVNITIVAPREHQMRTHANEHVSLVAFLLSREGGELRCDQERFKLRLPVEPSNLR